MEHTIQVDVVALTFLAGTIVPLLTALVTKLRSSATVKSTLTVVISIVTGVTTYLLANDGETTLYGLIAAAVATYLSAGVTYQNLWKPTGAALAAANLSPNAGLGAAQPLRETEIEPLTIEKVQAIVQEAIPAPVAPSVAESDPVTTLKGQPVYADPRGYLHVDKS